MLQRNAQVLQILRCWRQASEVLAHIIEAPEGAKEFLPGEDVRAVVLHELVGDVAVGDELRIDCSALQKRLGTGGYATVLATHDLPADMLTTKGHIVKARYMPHQHIVQSVEEPNSAHHATMSRARSLDSMPVIVADLHSSLPAVVAGIRSVDSNARVAYVWDDSAALPLAFSQSVEQMKQAGELCVTITSGQAFGGDLEAASMPSALLAARHVAKADYVVVAQGPGNLGTATRWGFSGTSMAHAIHVGHALGGRVLPVLRGSQADARPEHRGISHHSRSVLNDLVLIPLRLAIPTLDALDLDEDASASIADALQVLSRGHEVVHVDGHAAIEALDHTCVTLKTMGRTVVQDRLAFALASAVGIYAANL